MIEPIEPIEPRSITITTDPQDGGPTNLPRLASMFDHRTTALQSAVECHKYLYWLLASVSTFLIVVGIMTETVRVTLTIAIDPAPSTVHTLDAVAALCFILIKRFKFRSRATRHKMALRGAQDILDEIVYSRLRSARSRDDMERELIAINSKIATFRATEPIIPIWVKERYVSST